MSEERTGLRVRERQEGKSEGQRGGLSWDGGELWERLKRDGSFLS